MDSFSSLSSSHSLVHRSLNSSPHTRPKGGCIIGLRPSPPSAITVYWVLRLVGAQFLAVRIIRISREIRPKYWLILGIFTTASTNLIYATTVMALIALYHEDLVIQPWMTFVAYQILNIFTSGIVMFGNRFIPTINKFSCELLSRARHVYMWLILRSGLPAAGMVCHHGHSGCFSSKP